MTLQGWSSRGKKFWLLVFSGAGVTEKGVRGAGRSQTCRAACSEHFPLCMLPVLPGSGRALWFGQPGQKDAFSLGERGAGCGGVWG